MSYAMQDPVLAKRSMRVCRPITFLSSQDCPSGYLIPEGVRSKMHQMPEEPKIEKICFCGLEALGRQFRYYSRYTLPQLQNKVHMSLKIEDWKPREEKDCRITDTEFVVAPSR